jgi:tripartite-type tricarboxylate transporter receptor subunit TctC
MKNWILAALVALACAAALAQSGPAGPAPLVLVVGGPAGNPGDLLLRSLSAPLSGELGQPVVIENKPGAAGTIALAAVARSRPDGNVLGLLALQSAVAPSLIKSLPYDTRRDLLPVRQLSWVTNVLVVAADSPLQSLEDVLQRSRGEPLTFASGGNGTPAHLAAELFAHEAGVQLRHVPFNGAMAGVNAVLGGHVQLMFATAPSVTGLLQAGKLRALASVGPGRLPWLPATPTLAESGLPGATMRDWHGLVAPAGTPMARVERIARALDKVLAAEAVRQAIAGAGLEPVVVSTPEEFKTLVTREVGRWGEVVRRAGISLQ